MNLGARKRTIFLTTLTAAILGFFSFVPQAFADTDIYAVGTALQITGIRLDIFAITAGLGTFLAWLGGGLLDITIALFLVDMVGTLKSLQLESLIFQLWEIIRDLFNLLFIFGLIYAGFKLILGIDDSGSKRTIGYIVVAALLINFSLYAVQVVIDVGNVVAGQIHKKMTTNVNISALDESVGSISDSFTSFVQIDRLATEANQLTEEEGILNNPNTWYGAFLLGLLFLFFFTLLGFMFAAGAILIFTRFVMLVGFMVFSPLLLLGLIFPKMAGKTSGWPKMFLNQVIVGPLYLFMLYLSLRAFQQLAAMPDLTILNITIYMSLISAFLWGSLMVAKRFGAVGADRAMSWGGSLTAGVTARGLQNTVGKWSQKYAESDKAKDRAEKSWLGRRAFNITSSLSNKSFDARNVGGVGKKLGIGEGLKDGYKSKTEAIAKKEKEFADKLGTVDNDDERVSALQLEVDATEQAMKTGREDIKKKQEDITVLEARKKTETGAAKAATQADIDLKKSEITVLRTKLEEHKEEVEKQKENVQREKLRRQLGDEKRAPLHMNRIGDAKKDLKQLLVNYADERAKKVAAEKAGNTTALAAAEGEMSRLTGEIAAKKKEIANEEKDARKYMGGYARTVESAGIIKRFFTGRNKEQNENAAKEIRDEYKKKIKNKDK